MRRNKNKSSRGLSTCHVDGNGEKTQESGETESENEEEFLGKFEQELKWCIWKLEKQLSSKGLNEKRAEQTTKTLKSLINPKNTFIKKRVLMRSVFGDYRKQMQNEEAEFEKHVKEMAVSRIESSDLQGIFYKKSRTKANEVDDSFKLTKSDNSFKFNFVTNIEEKNEHK